MSAIDKNLHTTSCLSEPPDQQQPQPKNPAPATAVRSTSQGPVSRQLACLIDGVHTEFICRVYEDALAFLVTQTMKPGTLIHAVTEQFIDGKQLCATSTLLGKRDDPLTDLVARQLSEALSLDHPGATSSQRDLVLSCALATPFRSFDDEVGEEGKTALASSQQEQQQRLHSTARAIVQCCRALAADALPQEE